VSYAGNRLSIRLFVGCASCLLAAALRGQIVPAIPNLADLPHVYGPDLIRSVHPVSDAADLLRKSHLKAISYEDPLWAWPGEMRVFNSKVDPATKGGSTPTEVAFTLPAQSLQRRTCRPDSPRSSPRITNRPTGLASMSRPPNSAFTSCRSRCGIGMGGWRQPKTRSINLFSSHRRREQHTNI
jgi:hypothetical protein